MTTFLVKDKVFRCGSISSGGSVSQSSSLSSVFVMSKFQFQVLEVSLSIKSIASLAAS